MIFVTFNYLSSVETIPTAEGGQRVLGSYFGAASTPEGVMEILRGAMRPDMVMSDVRLFGQADKPVPLARTRAWFQRRINQLLSPFRQGHAWLRVRVLGFKIGRALRRRSEAPYDGPMPPEHVNCRSVLAYKPEATYQGSTQ